jgi:hypothetical protein
MITKSPAELRRSRDRPAGVRSRETRRARIGGDTDALDWRSDPHLLAILARSVKREREGRDTNQFRRDELDQPALRPGARPRRPGFTPAGAV